MLAWKGSVCSSAASGVEMYTWRLCQSFLGVAIQGGGLVDLPLCKKPLALLPDAEGVMKASVRHTEEWNRKTPELRVGAGGNLGRTLPTSFCLKTAVLGQLKACECLARVLYPLQELLPH